MYVNCQNVFYKGVHEFCNLFIIGIFVMLSKIAYAKLECDRIKLLFSTILKIQNFSSFGIFEKKILLPVLPAKDRPQILIYIFIAKNKLNGLGYIKLLKTVVSKLSLTIIFKLVIHSLSSLEV